MLTNISILIMFMNILVLFNFRVVQMLIKMDFINGGMKKVGQVKTVMLGAKEGGCHSRVLFPPSRMGRLVCSLLKKHLQCCMAANDVLPDRVTDPEEAVQIDSDGCVVAWYSIDVGANGMSKFDDISLGRNRLQVDNKHADGVALWIALLFIVVEPQHHFVINVESSCPSSTSTHSTKNVFSAQLPDLELGSMGLQWNTTAQNSGPTTMAAFRVLFLLTAMPPAFPDAMFAATIMLKELKPPLGINTVSDVIDGDTAWKSMPLSQMPGWLGDALAAMWLDTQLEPATGSPAAALAAFMTVDSCLGTAFTQQREMQRTMNKQVRQWEEK